MKKALSLIMVFMVAVMWSATGFSSSKYASGNIGMSWLDDSEAWESLDWTTDPDGYKNSYDSGLTLTGALGCDFGDYRLEGELGYQGGDIKSFTYVSDGEDVYGEDLTGDVSILSLMVNGYYDIDLGSGVELFPYAGVGVAQVKFDNVSAVFDEGESNGDGHLEYEASEVTFAYQIGLGLGIPVSDDIMLDARYRYFGTTEFTISDDISGRIDDDNEYNLDMESHSGLIGLRVNF